VAAYKLLIATSAAKELDVLPLKDRRRMAARIGRLALDPRPAGVEKLSGQEKYRLRQGDYRILFSIDDADRHVIIVKIGHRREVYR
jgi:mRNA interferase RelE/StbE